MDQVTVEVEDTEGNQSLYSQYAESLQKQIKDNIGLSMAIVIKTPGSIPRSEGGKLKRIVDNR